MLKSIDHIVLTARNIEATLRFYEEILLAPAVQFGNGRYALQIGSQKINLHEARHEFEPKAAAPTPGSIDLCFLTDTPIGEVAEHLHDKGVEIELGPCDRTGATGPIESIYIRDPDGNLIEIANQV